MLKIMEAFTLGHEWTYAELINNRDKYKGKIGFNYGGSKRQSVMIDGDISFDYGEGMDNDYITVDIDFRNTYIPSIKLFVDKDYDKEFLRLYKEPDVKNEKTLEYYVLKLLFDNMEYKDVIKIMKNISGRAYNSGAHDMKKKIKKNLGLE